AHRAVVTITATPCRPNSSHPDFRAISTPAFAAMKNLFALISCFAASLTLAQDGTYYFNRLAGVTGVVGGTDGTVMAPRFYVPLGLSFDPAGNLYVADAANNMIRKLPPTSTSSTIAGVTELAGSLDGSGSNARFNFPSAVAVDASGNILVADT